MDITFEQIETRLNNTRMKARVNKMVVSKPYIIESKISIVPNDIINKLFETNEQVTDILVTYNKKTKEILKIKAKMAKEELLLLRISDSEGMAGLLGLMPTNNVVEWIMTVNNLYSHNTNINAIEIHNRPERFYIITLKTYNDRYKTIGIIALYIRGSQKNRRGEISRFVILPPYQNKKYGQTALKKAIKLIQYNELKPFVWVREDNEIMQHIVEKLGFKSTTRTRHNREIDKDFIKWVYKDGEIETIELDKIELTSNNRVSQIPNLDSDRAETEHKYVFNLCTCPYCVERRRTKELRRREERQIEVPEMPPNIRPRRNNDAYRRYMTMRNQDRSE